MMFPGSFRGGKDHFIKKQAGIPQGIALQKSAFLSPMALRWNLLPGIAG